MESSPGAGAVPGASAASLESVRAEGVLHGRVGQHQVALQHVQGQRVHPELVIQREGVHLKAGDVGQRAGDLFGQARRRVACRRRGRGLEACRRNKQKTRRLARVSLTCEDDVGHVMSSVAPAEVLVLIVEELLVTEVLQV